MQWRACVHACYVDVRTVNGSLVLPFVTALLICSVWPKPGKMLTALFSSRLCGAAYNVVDHARPRTADNLWVNHGSVAIVATRRCRYRVVAGWHFRSPTVWVRLRTCPCRLFRCDRRPAVPARLAAGAAAAADIHWRTDARALNLTLCLCIVSYRDILCDIDRIVSFSLRAISCQHYMQFWENVVKVCTLHVTLLANIGPTYVIFSSVQLVDCRYLIFIMLLSVFV